MEGLRLEWSYLEGRDNHLLGPDPLRNQNRGLLDEGYARGTEAPPTGGGESSFGIARRFGPGHVISRRGENAYVARCGMVVVEIRNQTICTQEIPMTFKGEQMYVEPLTLILQPTATRVNFRRGVPPRWRAGGE